MIFVSVKEIRVPFKFLLYINILKYFSKFAQWNKSVHTEIMFIVTVMLRAHLLYSPENTVPVGARSVFV